MTTDTIRLDACEALGEAIETTAWPPVKGDVIGETRTGHGAVVAAALYRKGFALHKVGRPPTADDEIYWLHVHQGTELAQYGSFASPAAAHEWREPYYDKGGAMSDAALELPDAGYFDDYESDAWILVTVAGTKLTAEI